MDAPCVTNQITNWLTISQGLKSNNRVTWNLAWGVRIAQNCLNREYTIYIYMLWTHHDEFHCCSQILWHQVILLLSVPEAWHNLSSLHSLKRQYTLVEDFFPFLWPVGLTIYWYCKRKDCCCCVTNSSQIYSRGCKNRVNSFTNFPWDRSYYNQVKKKLEKLHRFLPSTLSLVIILLTLEIFSYKIRPYFAICLISSN